MMATDSDDLWMGILIIPGLLFTLLMGCTLYLRLMTVLFDCGMQRLVLQLAGLYRHMPSL